MAKIFTSKDIKNITNEYEELNETLERPQKEFDHNIKSAQDIILLMLENSSLNTMVEGFLLGEISTSQEYPELNEIYQFLQRCVDLKNVIAEKNRISVTYSSEIFQALMDIKCAKNPLIWTFTGRKKRLAAEEAYNKLIYLIENGYKNDVLALNLLFEDTVNKFDNNTSSYTDDNRKNYYKILLDNGFNFKDSQPNIIEILFSKLNKNQKLLDTANSNIVSIANNIRAISRDLSAETTMLLLQDIPVEQIKSITSGIKIKTLRDAGYETIADVYSSSVYNIASIYGISENMAREIHSAAKQVVKNVSSSSKIKLSADNQTETASDMVTELHLYINACKLRDEVKKLYEYNRIEFKESIATLNNLGNGAAWLFYTDEEKALCKISYIFLCEYLESEYSKALNTYYNYSANGIENEVDSWNDFKNNSILYYNTLEKIVPGVLGNDDALYGLPEDLAKEIQEECIFPDGLLCTLRKYQEWGVRYVLHQERVLLGDEMGLGKTIQAIAVMVSLKNTGATHFLVICPASVIENWCREVRKHSKLSVIKVHGNGRMSAIKEWIKNGGVAITTYETTGYFDQFDDYVIDQIIVDEAHYIKNKDAQRTVNSVRLCNLSKRILLMTGTALENRVDEMISLIDILQPKLANDLASISYMSAAPQFREKIAPVYYRRKREDVLTELPDLIEEEEWCELSPREEQLYEQSIIDRNYAQVRQVSWNVNDLKYSSKASRLKEIIEEAKEDDRKVLVFSFFLNTIASIQEYLGPICIGPINGSVSPQRRQELIDQFEKSEPGTVLLAQIQAGGTGLNIQAASVVVLCEPQFKPSIENQAISRAYRMGQARNVLVFRLLSENTVDEKLMDVLNQKQALFDAFADKSIAADNTVEIDDKKFGEIIEEEIERINKKNGNSIVSTNGATSTNIATNLDEEINQNISSHREQLSHNLDQLLEAGLLSESEYKEKMDQLR